MYCKGSSSTPGGHGGPPLQFVPQESGDTRSAEALLSSQEHEEAAQIGIPGTDDVQQRREAAALAREQGALALGHNVRAALEAFQSEQDR